MKFQVIHKQWDRHSNRVSTAVNDAPDDFRDVIHKEAFKIKTDWARRWRPSRHLPSLGASVSADVRGGGGMYTAEIGPERGGQGSLGHLIEDANGRARNRATHAGNKASRRSETRFPDAAGDAAEDGVGG